MGLLGDIDAYDFFFGKRRKSKRSTIVENNYSDNVIIIFSKSFTINDRDQVFSIVKKLETDINIYNRQIQQLALWVTTEQELPAMNISKFTVHAINQDVADQFFLQYPSYPTLFKNLNNVKNKDISWNEIFVGDFWSELNKEFTQYLIFTMNLKYPAHYSNKPYNPVDYINSCLQKDIQTFNQLNKNSITWIDSINKTIENEDYKFIKVYTDNEMMADIFKKTYSFYIQLSVYLNRHDQDVLKWFMNNEFRVSDFDGLKIDEIIIPLNELKDYVNHYKGIKLGKENQWLELVRSRLNLNQWYKIYGSERTVSCFLPNLMMRVFDLEYYGQDALLFSYYYISQHERFKIDREQFKKDLIESLNRYVYDDYFIPKLK